MERTNNKRKEKKKQKQHMNMTGRVKAGTKIFMHIESIYHKIYIFRKTRY